MTEQTPKVIPLKRLTCPACGKTTSPAWKPFCSKRCADLDLGHWFNESYRIESEEKAESEET